MALAEKFEELEIWKLARVQVMNTYAITQTIKDFGFKDQIQRACISVMNNIAEGFERRSSKDFSHFLNIAKSSCGEVRSMIYVAEDLGYIRHENAEKLRNKSEMISRKTAALIKYLDGKR